MCRDRAVRAGKVQVLADEEAARAFLKHPRDVETLTVAGVCGGLATFVEATSACYAYSKWNRRVLELWRGKRQVQRPRSYSSLENQWR